MSEYAHILHADLDSFFASVEQRDDPSLRGRPVLVGAGVVLAASYEAKARGVRTPMNGREAKRRCPGAITVTPRFRAYTDASKDVFKIFRDLTPVVEGISIDEAFLDISGLRRHGRTPWQIGEQLRERVRREAGLPISVGIAARKFIAKIASAAAKPDGLLLVEPGRELEFLHPLPVERLWGVGAATSPKLHRLGVRTIADIAAIGPHALASELGPGAGWHLYQLATARDPRRVRHTPGRKSIGAQRAIGRGPHSPADIDAVATELLDRVGSRLRKAELACRTVEVRLRFADFSRATRSHTSPDPLRTQFALQQFTRELLSHSATEIRARGLTLLGIGLSGLVPAVPEQLALPLHVDPQIRESRHVDEVAGRTDADLDIAMDKIRARFGEHGVHSAGLVGHERGFAAPTLAEAEPSAARI